MFGWLKKKPKENAAAGVIPDALLDGVTERLKEVMLPPMRQGFIETFEKNLTAQGVTDPSTRKSLLESALKGFEKGAMQTIREHARKSIVENMGKA